MFNLVVLTGRLTADPELKTTGSGIVVTSFSIAVTRRFAKSADGQSSQQSDFINCVAWSKTGEFVSKYFKKGQQMGACGRIQTRSWDDQNGQKRYTTEVVLQNFNSTLVMLDGRSGDGAPMGSGDIYDSASSGWDNTPSADAGVVDDDIPF